MPVQRCSKCGYEGGRTVVGLCIDCAASRIVELEKHINHLRKALALIGNAGGTVNEELGLTCNGTWCGEQAREALYYSYRHVPGMAEELE